MIEKLKQIPKDYRQIELKTFAGALCIYAASYLLEVFELTSIVNLFQRSGSLVVCLGIWYGLLNLHTFLDVALTIYKKEFAAGLGQADTITKEHLQEKELKTETLKIDNNSFEERRIDVFSLKKNC